MGNVHGGVVASLSVCCVYFLYVHVYRAHTVLKSSVLRSDAAPSAAYLWLRRVVRAGTRTPGRLYAGSQTRHVVTLLGCRLQTSALRSFCSAAGYGWDYPDSEYRDVPLCFLDFLCSSLMLVLITGGNFRLSPAGLVRVRQTLKSLQPVDELKKAPFTLQAEVVEYRRVEAGVEVDVRLSAASRHGSPVWESAITLLSREKPGAPSVSLQGQSDEAPSAKWVELRVPRTSVLLRPWLSCVSAPYRLVSRLLPPLAAPPLCVLSLCLAEIEKHKGVGAVTAPVSVQVRFGEPVAVDTDVTVGFWETSGEDGGEDGGRDGGEDGGEDGGASPGGLGFLLEQRGDVRLLGRISRTSSDAAN